MPYSVTYTTRGIAKYKARSRHQFIKRIVLFITVTVIGFILCYAPIRSQMMQIFFPGDYEITREAAAQMIVDIRNGQPVGEAVTAFCQEILEYDIR